MNDFFAFFYEFFPESSTFSDDLYFEELYSPIGISTVLVGLFLAVTYYYIVNRPKFASWPYWLGVLIFNSAIALLLGMVIPSGAFEELGIEYGSEYFFFGLKNALLAVINFIFWTYLLKWGSSNTKGTPKLFFGKF